MKTPLPKLGIIGTVGVPAKYGGFETLVHYLVKNLHDRLDMTVYCSQYNYEEHERRLTWNGAKLHYIPLRANGLQSILYDMWSMIHAARHSDVLLVLGVSGCLFLPVLKLFSRKKVIVNIDGLEWRRPKWNWLAKKFLLVSEIIACRFADEIVTDNRILKEYVKIRYNIDGNLIEYGADHARKVPIRPEDVARYPFLAKPYAFKVARIEPENNIHVILKAFSRVPAQTLVLVGNWDNSLYGRSLRNQYVKAPNLHLLDPIYDLPTLDLLRTNAKYYVHGHSAGGTNPSLVEAMYCALPVVAFDVIYNRVTANNQALFFHDAESLQNIIANIDRFPLSAIARDLKAFANRRYTWASVANRYAQLVEGVERLPVPGWVPGSVSEELAQKALPEPDFALPTIEEVDATTREEPSSFVRA
ncbi:MAG: DUF1972 domain-containing protein [Bacteroidetes bacterium]|nr:MAG: DUF1972 domain-containing protein [Bacteroidota bacterium]